MSPKILVLTAAAIVSVTVAGIGERAERAREHRPDPFSLFADPAVLIAVNDVQITLDNTGNIGVPTVNGTQFLRWPKGSPNQYLFNSGLQIAGLIEGDAGPWTGDTVGAFFFDAQGGQSTGWPRDEIYVSTNTLDLANWPLEAYVTDAELFPEALLGRKSASQQDSWTKYWDGDPISSAPTVKHPMGIQVTQRSMAWTFPLGNETVIYWILRFKNVTNDPEFQQLNQLHYFGDVDALPDEGWNLRDIYVALAADPDIGIQVVDFSTAILPFNLGIAYGGHLREPNYVYPPDIFFPPFFTTSPGFFGIKYLKSPTDPDTGREVGLTLISSTQLGEGIDFPDPFGDDQLYRYLSGQFDAAQGDPPCNVRPEIDTGDPATTEQSVCFIGQSAVDTRFFQASGPFTLEPGEETTIAIAYLVAPVVERMPDGTPSGMEQGLSSVPEANSPGFPSFHPGFESARGCDPGGVNCRDVLSAAENAVKNVERGAGWVAYNGAAPGSSLESIDNRLDQFAVDVVPGSILGRALVAQSIFDNKFLLGFAPEPPPFYLVPGDEQVTIVWQPTPSEAEGDPFADAAADPTNRLYNPNYRRYDIEGYRIWRGQGTEIRDLELIAQFDYTNTSYIDHTCETILPEETVFGVARVDPFTGDTIGDLTGYSRNEICPFEDGPRQLAIDQFLVFNNGAEGGPPGGGVSRNPDNTNDVVRLDTVIVSDRLLPLEDKIPLQDNGVPFAFVDDEVQNNFTYFYAVTAFDVNSPTSGSISLRSPKLTKTVVPRQLSPDLVEPFASTTAMLGADDVPLDPDQPNVQPDSDTGVFPGPQPPTPVTRQELSLAPEDVGNLIAQGPSVSRIDSIVPETVLTGCEGTLGNGLGACWTIYMTHDDGQNKTQTDVEGTTPVWGAFTSNSDDYEMGMGTLRMDDEALARFSIPAGFGEGIQAVYSAEFGQSIGYSSNEGQLNRRQGGNDPGPVAGGSRWFSGGQETVPHPTTFIRVGHLEGVDTVWAPIHHTPRSASEGPYAESGDMQCFGYTIAFLGRAADVRFRWGDEGFESVEDVTHRVAVPFATSPRASWGFLNTDGNGNGVIDWHDFDYLDAVLESTSGVNFFCEFADNGIFDPPKSFLEETPIIQPTSTNGDDPPLGPLPPTGTGFGLYVNGERYIFELPTGTRPEAGTEWTLRTYSGYMQSADQFTDTPSSYELSDHFGTFEDPEGNTLFFGTTGQLRPPLITGLRFQTDVQLSGVVDTGVPDLTLVHTVPDPYRSTSAYDRAPTEKQLMFVNLPYRATLRIYSLSGVLVQVLEHNDPSGGGRLSYNLRNRNNQFIASGVYFFHVITPEGYEHVGKFTVIITGE